MPEEQIWWLYLVQCDGFALYTGISTDVARRLRQHRGEIAGGARYTRTASEIDLLYAVELGARGVAMRAERRIKRLARRRKLAIVAAQPDADALLTLLGLAPDGETKAERGG